VRAVGALALTCALLLIGGAAATAAPQTSVSDIEDEVMCPTCGTALSLSESPVADRMRAYIQRLVDEGRTKTEIKQRLVDEFGPEVLASPPRHGFTLTSYVVPLIGFALAALSIALTLLRRRGSVTPGPPPAGTEFEELVDADLAGDRRG
jgi:cytochrome c-type biogenesis protein CcmH/NrfF